MQQYCSEYADSCSTVVQQNVDVALPISLIPSINLGDIKIMCCGEPRVECCDGCGGLSLKITQTVTYKIPIEYSVKAITGEVASECKKNIPTADCMHYRY